MDKASLIEIMGKLSKKGYYDILLFISEKGPAHYSDILGYMLGNKIVRSDATVTQALNSFAKLNLVKRKISQERPIRTNYELTKKGKEFVRHLTELQSLES